MFVANNITLSLSDRLLVMYWWRRDMRLILFYVCILYILVEQKVSVIYILDEMSVLWYVSWIRGHCCGVRHSSGVHPWCVSLVRCQHFGECLWWGASFICSVYTMSLLYCVSRIGCHCCGLSQWFDGVFWRIPQCCTLCPRRGVSVAQTTTDGVFKLWCKLPAFHLMSFVCRRCLFFKFNIFPNFPIPSFHKIHVKGLDSL